MKSVKPLVGKKKKASVGIKVTKMQAHKIMGHLSDTKTMALEKRLGYDLIKDTYYMCKDCMVAKIRQKNMKKVTEKVYM